MKQKAKFGRNVALTRAFSFPEVIIGHNLNALAHSVMRSIPVIYNAPKDFAYDVWDSVGPNLNLEKIFCDNEQRTLATIGGQTKTFGALKQDLHSKMTFLNAMSGFIPFGDKIESISLNKSDIQVVLSNGQRYVVNYKLAHIYDTNMIVGGTELVRSSLSKVKTSYAIKDYYQLFDINKEEIDFLYPPEPFVDIMPLLAISWEYYTCSTFCTKTPNNQEFHQVVFLEKIENFLKNHFPNIRVEHKFRDIIKNVDGLYKNQQNILFVESSSFEDHMNKLSNEMCHYNPCYRSLDYLLTDKYYEETRKFKNTERTDKFKNCFKKKAKLILDNLNAGEINETNN